ncbi:MAG: hypothetical protein WB778_08660 [Thermoplasmata archaeon]
MNGRNHATTHFRARIVHRFEKPPIGRWVGLILLVGLLLPAIGIEPVTADPQAAGVVSEPRADSGAQLTVEPSVWLMESGSSATFSATWIGIAGDCAPESAWYFWNGSRPFVGGYLNSTSGPGVEFTAASAITGVVNLTVRSTTEITCNNQSSSVQGFANVRITVVAPLVASPLASNATLLTPGASVSIRGSIEGGLRPYHVRASFGDGTEINLTVGNPGPFSLEHAYPKGSYRPDVTIEDSGGSLVSSSLPSPLNVSDGPAIAIRSSVTAAEMGRPLTLSAELLGIQGDLEYQWSVAGHTFATTSNVSFDDSYPVNFTTSLEVIRVVPPLNLINLEITTDLSIPVNPLPSVTWGPLPSQAEAGRAISVGVAIREGTSPYELHWQLPPSSLAGNLSMPVPGTYFLLLAPSTPGDFQLDATLTDGDGSGLHQVLQFPIVEPPLELSVAANRSPAVGGVLQTIQLETMGGAGPFWWCVAPSESPASASPLEGEAEGDGTFVWSGLFQTVGNVSFSIFFLDNASYSVSDFVELSAVPPLTASLSVYVENGTSGPELNATVALGGGLAPFHVALVTDGSPWISSWLSSDGIFSWIERANQSGAVTVGLQLRDSAQETFGENQSVVVPPNTTTGPSPPPPPPPVVSSPVTATGNGAWSIPIEILAAVGVGGLAFVGLRAYLSRARRGPAAPPTPGVDASEVLRRLVTAGDGIERGSLELLAEDAGLALSQVRATIERLERDGVLRTELGIDGEELLTWVGAPPGPEKST